MSSAKGEDLDQLFSFLGEEQLKPTGGGKDEKQYVNIINRELDELMGEKMAQKHTQPEAAASAKDSEKN